MNKAIINEQGNRYGRLYVVCDAGVNDKRCAMWLCQCDCGECKIITGSNLRRSCNSKRSHGTQSCGCLQRDRASEPPSEKIRKKMSIAQKGRTASTETRRKMSKAAKNRPPISEETRRKKSEFMIGRYCGENSPRWNPNLTDEDRARCRHIPGYEEWRIAVYEKDSYTCQYCGDNTGGNLHAHHIESYDNNPDLRTKTSNGITLCENCHKDFHHQYGWGNNTREQLNIWMTQGETK